jgi:hypothetical protein
VFVINPPAIETVADANEKTKTVKNFLIVNKISKFFGCKGTVIFSNRMYLYKKS